MSQQRSGLFLLGDETNSIIANFLDIEALAKLFTCAKCSRSFENYFPARISSLHTRVITARTRGFQSYRCIFHLKGDTEQSKRFTEWLFSAPVSLRSLHLFLPRTDFFDKDVIKIIGTLSDSLQNGALHSLESLIVCVDDCTPESYTLLSYTLKGSINASCTSGHLNQLRRLGIEINAHFTDIGYPHTTSYIPTIRQHCRKLKVIEGFRTFSLQDIREFLSKLSRYSAVADHTDLLDGTKHAIDPCDPSSGVDTKGGACLEAKLDSHSTMDRQACYLTWPELECLDLGELLYQISYHARSPRLSPSSLSEIGSAEDADDINRLFTLADRDSPMIAAAKYVLPRLHPVQFPSLRKLYLMHLEALEAYEVFEELINFRLQCIRRHQTEEESRSILAHNTASIKSAVHTKHQPENRKDREAKSFFGDQILELDLDIASINAHDHFEYSQRWADLFRQCATTSNVLGLRGDGFSTFSKSTALFPKLQVLRCNSWLPCSQFLHLLVGNSDNHDEHDGRFSRPILRENATTRSFPSASMSVCASLSPSLASASASGLRLEVCPGIEDPCFSSFLLNKWDPSLIPLTALVLRRRQFFPPSGMVARYFYHSDLGLDPDDGMSEGGNIFDEEVRRSLLQPRDGCSGKPSAKSENTDVDVMTGGAAISSDKIEEEIEEGVGNDFEDTLVYDLKDFDDEYVDDVELNHAPSMAGAGTLSGTSSSSSLLTSSTRELYGYHPVVSKALHKAILSDKCSMLVELGVLEDFLKYTECFQPLPDEDRYPLPRWEKEVELERVERSVTRVKNIFHHLKSLCKLTIYLTDARRLPTTVDRKKQVERALLVFLSGIRASRSTNNYHNNNQKIRSKGNRSSGGSEGVVSESKGKMDKRGIQSVGDEGNTIESDIKQTESGDEIDAEHSKSPEKNEFERYDDGGNESEDEIDVGEGVKGVDNDSDTLEYPVVEVNMSCRELLACLLERLKLLLAKVPTQSNDAAASWSPSVAAALPSQSQSQLPSIFCLSSLSSPTKTRICRDKAKDDNLSDDDYQHHDYDGDNFGESTGYEDQMNMHGYEDDNEPVKDDQRQSPGGALPLAPMTLRLVTGSGRSHTILWEKPIPRPYWIDVNYLDNDYRTKNGVKYCTLCHSYTCHAASCADDS